MTTCIGGCGIMSGYKEMKMVKYLNEKYPEDHFRYIKSVGGTPLGSLLGTDSVTTIECSSETYPDKNITVMGYWDEEVFCDNYLGIKYAEMLDEHIDALMYDLFPTQKKVYKSFVNEAEQSGCKELPADTTFEEYLGACGSTFCVFVEQDEDSLDREYIKKEIIQKFKDDELFLGGIKVYFVNEIDDAMSYEECLEQDMDYCVLIIGFDQKRKIKWERWEEKNVIVE